MDQTLPGGDLLRVLPPARRRPSKEASWLAANIWWEAKQAEIDAKDKASRESPEDVLKGRINDALDAADTIQLRALIKRAEAAKVILATLEDREGRGGDINPYVVRLEAEGGLVTTSAARALAAPVQANRTVRAQVEDWLALLRASVGQKLIGEGRYDAYARHIRIFQDWLGADQPVEVVTAAKLEQWWAYLSLQIGEGRYAPSYAKTIFMTSRQWIRRLGEVGTIPLPGNIAARRFRFGDGPKQVERLTLDEVKKLIAGCDGFSERTLLYLLLMLNCGMYQSDISDLGQDEVDWDKGTLTRPRSKTPRGPKVTYKWWPETFALLTKYRATAAVPNERGANRAILTERNGPLVRYWMENGKMRRFDIVQSAFSRLWMHCGLRKPIKPLRKTSASELAANPEFSPYVQYFLAHSPKGVADRHYMLPDNQAFFRALDWLRGRYFQEERAGSSPRIGGSTAR